MPHNFLKGKRSWQKEEDDLLVLQKDAEPELNWESVARESGLKRTANSCRLRWLNHLKPKPRPGKLTIEEKLLILELRSLWGGKNCWSKIAKHLLPGRRDNDAKNFWHSLAKTAKRKGCDAELDAFVKRVELMEMIKAAGKFSMDYSLILPLAFNKLKELLPDLAVAGGGAVTDIGALSPAAADAVTIGEFGDGGGPIQMPEAEVDSVSIETSNQGYYEGFWALLEQHEFHLEGDLNEFDHAVFSDIDQFGFYKTGNAF